MKTMVKIAYLIDMKETFNKVAGLLNETNPEDLALYYSTLVEYVNEENTTKAIKAIVQIREQLMELDLRLGDCENILSAYVQEVARIEAGKRVVEIDPEKEVPNKKDNRQLLKG